MGASTPVGTILCYVVGFLTTKFLQYRFSFLIGGIVCCFMGVLWFILYDKLIKNLYIERKQNYGNKLRKNRS